MAKRRTATPKPTPRAARSTTSRGAVLVIAASLEPFTLMHYGTLLQQQGKLDGAAHYHEEALRQ